MSTLMDTRIWVKTEDKRASILMLRGNDVHLLKVTGNLLTFKSKVKGVLEALEQGQSPSDTKAKLEETIDCRTINKAEVSPGNDSLKLYGGPDNAKKISYSTGDSDAGTILQTIIAKSGRRFQAAQEDIGVIEALIPPVALGAIAGWLWSLLYFSAGKIAAGETVEVNTGRKRGLRQLVVWIAEMLGMGGTIAVGVLLLALVVGWAATRIVKRPQRTVWLPE
jgi:hypothetical protein